MKIFFKTKAHIVFRTLIMVCFVVIFLQSPTRCLDEQQPDEGRHKITATISSIRASVEKALQLHAEGKKVIAIFDLCGTITHGREGDPILLNSVPYKPDWAKHYKQCEPLSQHEGLLPQDLVNQFLREPDIPTWTEQLKGASIPVIAATGRLPLSDEEVGVWSGCPDWLQQSAKAEKPTDAVAVFKEKALAALKEKFPDTEEYNQQMLSFAKGRSAQFEQRSKVKFSGQEKYEGLFAFEGGFYANGIAYMSYDKRKGILSLIDALTQEGALAAPSEEKLHIVFTDDDQRTMDGFTKISAQDYLSKGIIIHLMHYPWEKADASSDALSLSQTFNIHQTLRQEEDQETFAIIDLGDPGTDVDDLIDLIGWISHPSICLATKLVVSTDEVEGGKRARFIKKIFEKQGINVPVVSGKWRGNPESFLMDNNDLVDTIETNYIDRIKDVIETAHISEKKLIIKSHGPLTELSEYFTQFPDHKAYVHCIIQMGGALELANHKQEPKKEYNIIRDIKATQHIFKEFGEKIYLVTLDTTTATPYYELHPDSDIMGIIQKSPYADLVSRNLDRFLTLVKGKYACSVMHDALAASVVESMVLHRPFFVTFTQERISIDDEGLITKDIAGTLVWVSHKESFSKEFREVWLKNPNRYSPPKR